MKFFTIAIISTVIVIGIGITLVVIPLFLFRGESFLVSYIPFPSLPIQEPPAPRHPQPHTSYPSPQQPTNVSCYCVAFRIEDVQDYWLNSVQMEILNTFSEKNATMTIGAIGNIGEDRPLISFIRQIPMKEIAMHGLYHEDFTKFNETAQSLLMDKALGRLESEFGSRPEVFLPPYNLMNNDTVQAARENGIKYIAVNGDYPPYDNITILHSTVFTGDLNGDDTEWYGLDHEAVFLNIQDSLEQYGYAIVSVHPQEHAMRDGLNFHNEVDEKQIKELGLLIDKIREERLAIVTISQLGTLNSTATI